MTTVTENHVSKQSDLDDSRVPDALAEFSLAELRVFCELSKLMLRGGDLAASAKELGLNRKNRDRFELVHDSLKTKLGLDVLPKQQGKASKYCKEVAPIARLRQILGCIEKALGSLKPVADMRKETLRPCVRIASVLSVVNYLGPTILESVQAAREPSNGWPPNISLHNGETADHFRDLLAGNVDICIAPEKAERPLGITSRKLNYISNEEGLVFRLRGTEKGSPFFPAMEEAIKSKNRHGFLKALLNSPVCLMHWELATGYDALSRALNDFFCDSRGSMELGPRVYVPTMRMSRQFTCRGLAVGIGHKPRCETEIFKSLMSPINEYWNGVVGFDPDFPQSTLVFLPLSMIGTTTLRFPAIPRVNFHVFFVGQNGKPDSARVSAETIELIKIIESIVKASKKSPYLEWATFDDEIETGTTLLHDFHWGGQDIKCE